MTPSSVSSSPSPDTLVPLRLTEEAFAALLGADIPVWLPTLVPERLTFDRVSLDDDAAGGSYALRLVGAAGEDLVVQGAASGLGDIFEGDACYDFEHPDMGAGIVHWYLQDDGEAATFHTSWMSPIQDFPWYSVGGQGLTPEEAMQVASGLRPMTVGEDL